jgi:peptidoglycan/xylan/chitin deacetylase (PgdA/CDA1 family)
MRAVIIVIGALVTLGLAAFGVVAAQKATSPLAFIGGPTSHVAAASPIARIADAARATPAPGASANSAGPIRLAQNTSGAAPAPTNTASGEPPPGEHKLPACDKPGGMGLSRVVEIDTTGGPAFGFEHFKQYDFLRDKEVVLTFDDGPWPENTRAVLKALQDNCLKATFFEIGEHASWHPELSKEVAAAGMTIGSHTWSHKDLARNPYASDIEKAKDEIEMGVSAVHMAVDGPIAPFFRFPDLQQPPELLTYLGTRNIATFSTDIDSFDFKMHKPDQVIKSVMRQLEKRGKGIVLMHDFQRATAEAMPELLSQLKAAGYKIVHIVPSHPVTTLAKYDEMVRQHDKYLASNNTRPGSSVFHTIGEYYGSPAPGTATGD